MQNRLKNTPNRHGFSLLEMAIVVTIIGLLVGSIVAGRNYILNARLNTMVNETRYYIGALTQFQDRYGAIPGDMVDASNYWSGASNGDGNGLIVAGTANSFDGTGLISTGTGTKIAEYFYAFQHLADSGLITGHYSGATGSGSTMNAVAGSNVPEGTIDSSAYFFMDIDGGLISSNTYYFDGYYVHPIQVGQVTSTGMPVNALISPADAIKIENKFDDGNPGLGWIRSFKGSVSWAASCVSGSTATTATYVPNSAATACRLIMTAQ